MEPHKKMAEELKRVERERDGYLKRMRQYEKDWQEAVAREGRLRDQMRESDEADTVCRILLHQELDAEREKVEELVTFAAYVVGVTDLLDHGDHAPPVEALRIARRKALELSGLAAHGGES